MTDISIPVSSSEFSDLGPAPITIRATTSPVVVVVADSQPAVSAGGGVIVSPGGSATFLPKDAASRAWGISNVATTVDGLELTWPLAPPGGGDDDATLSITAGDDTISAVTALTVIGATLSGGPSPNATLTITGGGGRVVTDITTGASDVDLTPPFADVYVITSGGTGSTETINLPAFGSYADANVGQTIQFLFQNATAGSDQPTVSYDGGPSENPTTVSVPLGLAIGFNGPVSFTVACDGLYWGPVGWSMAGSVGIGQGPNNQSTGYLSHAEGWRTSATGLESHAEGVQTLASGVASHSEGEANTASGNYSHAEGHATTASGDSAHAEGQFTTASGYVSHAEGQSTTASGNYSHAEGYTTTASGDVSHAEGQFTTASGNFSHSEGVYADARFIQGAHVEGNPVGGGFGKSQSGHYKIGGETTDGTTSVVLTFDGSFPSAINHLALPNGANGALGAAYVFTGQIVAVDPATGNMLTLNFNGAVSQGADAASTVLQQVLGANTGTGFAPGPAFSVIGGPGNNAVTFASAAWTAITAPALEVTFSADTINGALKITVVGIADTDINWMCDIQTSETTF